MQYHTDDLCECVQNDDNRIDRCNWTQSAVCACVFLLCSIYHQFLRLSDDVIIQLLIFEITDSRHNSQVEIPLFRTEEGRYLASSKLLSLMERQEVSYDFENYHFLLNFSSIGWSFDKSFNWSCEYPSNRSRSISSRIFTRYFETKENRKTLSFYSAICYRWSLYEISVLYLLLLLSLPFSLFILTFMYFSLQRRSWKNPRKWIFQELIALPLKRHHQIVMCLKRRRTATIG